MTDPMHRLIQICGAGAAGSATATMALFGINLASLLALLAGLLMLGLAR